MSTPAARSPSASVTTMTEFVLPVHTNALGNVFGGQVMAWMDLCGAICSQRHTGSICITAGIDDLSFEEPIQVGQVVRLTARVTAAFRTSIEVDVDVRGEDAMTGRTWRCVSAFLTFVAVDKNLKPTLVPPLEVTTDEEKLLAADAAARRAHRLARRQRI
jgi:acyl-CoA hydrolase